MANAFPGHGLDWGVIRRLAVALAVSVLLVTLLLHWGGKDGSATLALPSTLGLKPPGANHEVIASAEGQVGRLGACKLVVWGLNIGLYHLDSCLDVYRLRGGTANLVARLPLGERIWAPRIDLADLTGDNLPEAVVLLQRFDAGAGLDVCRVVWAQDGALRWSEFGADDPRGAAGLVDVNADGRPEIYTERPVATPEGEWAMDRKVFQWTGEGFALRP